MSLTTSVLLSVALTLRPESALRVVNPHSVAVDATLSCGPSARTLHLQPHALIDLGVDALCAAPTLDATLPLLALETRGETEQRVITTEETCAPVTMSAPLFACEHGVVTASVPPVDGATYAWTAEGATITEGASTNKVKVTVSDLATAKLVCKVTREGCSADATAIVAIRKPLLIRELKVPAEADAAVPLTITWTYEPGAEPNAQVLSGDAFSAPVALTAAQRSYTFTPQTSGTRNIELLASYATSIPTATTPKGRRRAVGATLAATTQCPSAHAARQVELRGCALAAPQIVMPQDVEAGSTFIASIEAHPGDAISWGVTNGTVLTPDYLPQIEVRANDNVASMEVSVLVTRGAKCSVSAKEHLVVRTRASCTTTPPTAALSILGRDCDTVTIQATFTGTPPFRGTWQGDATPFETSSNTVTRTVTLPGTYTINNFRDAICSGIVTQKAKVDSIKPTATLSAVNGSECARPDTKIVAKFTGTPPFIGEWNDGVKFTTNEFQIVRDTPEPFPYRVHALRDATCPNVSEDSEILRIVTPTNVDIETATICQYGEHANAFVPVMIYDGEAPFNIEWSDGVVTTTNHLGTTSRPVNISQPLQEFRITRVSSKRCNQLNLMHDTAKVALRPPVQIDRDHTNLVLCGSEVGSAKLADGLVGNPTIEWQLDGGKILTGQGTSAITFQPDGLTDAMLTVRTHHADGACDAFDGTTIFVMGEPDILDFKAADSTMKAGSFNTLTFSWERDVEFVSMKVEDPARENDLLRSGFICTDRKCSVPYKDTHGPGTSTITIFYGGPCNMNPGKQTSVTLTIVP